MDDSEAVSLEQVRAFLAGSGEAQISAPDTRRPYRMLLQPRHLFEFLVLYDLELEPRNP